MDVVKRPDKDLTRVDLRWTPEWTRKKGRTKTTWRRIVEAEMKEDGIC